MMNYLITGVTGGLGSAILDSIKDKVAREKVSLLVRSEEKANPFLEKGYDVRIADFSEKEKLVQAFSGIDTLMFVSSAPGQSLSREKQHQNVVEAAIEAGIKNIVYTSISNGEHSKASLAPDHIITEKLIKDSGLTYKILRNNWYLENERGTLNSAVNDGVFVYAAGDGKVGWALKREYAEAADILLVGEFIRSVIFELAEEKITYIAYAEAVSEVSGKEFEILSLSDIDFKKSLLEAGLPSEVVTIIAAIQSDIRHQELEVNESHLEQLLGHPQLDIHNAIREVLNT